MVFLKPFPERQPYAYMSLYIAIQPQASLLVGVDGLLDGLGGAQLLLWLPGTRLVGNNDIVKLVL